jgi:hypothetical protein
MSVAAQRDEMDGEMAYAATGTDGASASALQQIAAERLAAHRVRKAEAQAQEDELQAQLLARRMESRRGSSRVRDAVAARYQSSVSYREFLAAEAERALQQAQAEAEVAARNAKAVAEAQMKLMAELEQWNRPEPGPREQTIRREQDKLRGELAHALADIALGAQELMAEPPLLTIVDAEMPLRVQRHEDHARDAYSSFTGAEPASAAELHELEQEIEFRLSPQFAEHRIDTQPIPGNIIEFPRQLVAPRKARPRLAEGPLREEFEPLPQMRIFEVEAEQISVEPAPTESAAAPEWQSLQLDATSAQSLPFERPLEFAIAPQTAPLQLRVMAAMVDACCVVASFAGLAAAAAWASHARFQALPLPLVAGSVAGVLFTIFLIYKMMFFTLGEATPGMRYARIGFCTFADSNPTRKAMRRRVLASLLAACPIGLGIMWALLDSERLGWHDRMSRMYPRAY